MPRYIDADKLMKQIIEEGILPHDVRKSFEVFIRLNEDELTADVRENVHGQMIDINKIIKKLVPAGSDGEDLLIPLSAVISALQQTNRESICHCYDEKHSFGDVVDPAKGSCWDGFVRIFNSEKIITKIISADTDGPMTLNACLDVAKKMKMDGTIYVIFDDWLRGDIYAFNNYADGKWHYYGRTGGFA